MKYGRAGAVILVATLAYAQRSPEIPPGTPPPVFRSSDTDASREMPPDSKGMEPSDIEVQQQIGIKLASEPVLEDASVNVRVTPSEVVLSGTIHDEQQRQAALRIAQSYAGSRKVVDRMRIQQRKK